MIRSARWLLMAQLAALLPASAGAALGRVAIVARRLPDIPTRLARSVVAVVQALRRDDLFKRPGVAETLDWAMALAPYVNPFRTAGLCLYRDGRDSVAWHGDTIGRGKTEDTMVAIVSLGTPRPLLLRPVKGAGEVGGGSRPLRFEVGHGDLLVMGGSCQRTWEHAVPKTSQPVGPRISVQFRPRGVR